MKMSELAGKEIINLYDGGRLGTIGESDLIVDIDSGRVESLVLPCKNSLLSFWGDQQQIVIPWQAMKKIGTEVIIVELDQTNLKGRRYLL